MIIKCVVCSNDFYIRPCDFRNKKYRCCSRKCSFKNPNRSKITGKNHFNWKGSSAGYGSIHHFVRIRKKKPNKCEHCKKKTDFLDLANISQKYKRDIFDWEYLCRRCHMIKDGRIKNLILNKGVRPKLGKVKNCIVCNKSFYRKQSSLSKNNCCSLSCSGKYGNKIRWLK